LGGGGLKQEGKKKKEVPPGFWTKNFSLNKTKKKKKKGKADTNGMPNGKRTMGTKGTQVPIHKKEKKIGAHLQLRVGQTHQNHAHQREGRGVREKKN